MNLDKVTITGADDTIKPGELLGISQEYPFVEHGILFSAKHNGVARFPSNLWLSQLGDYAGQNKMNICLHLCGGWVRDFVCKGVMTFAPRYAALWAAAQRVQLNFHAEKHQMHKNFVAEMKRYPKDYIFQVDGVNDFVQAMPKDVRAFPLFDLSGGAGILPRNGWPKPVGDYIGYAGGLGPENLKEQIPLIAKAAGDTRFWIDMETKVRSEDNRQFDLERVRACLEASKPFVGANVQLPKPAPTPAATPPAAPTPKGTTFPELSEQDDMPH